MTTRTLLTRFTKATS
jgi:hypothetical protein